MTSESPLFSIITTTFNASSTIEACILKVQEQGFADYEHLIIDGDSNDTTVDIVKRLEVKFKNIKLYSQKDKGVYDAMNKGVHFALGEWFFFLGSDDFFYSKDVLKNIAEVIKKNSSIQIVYGNVWFERLQRFYDGRFSVDKILKHNICHQSVFYQKDLFKQIGLFNLNYTLHADYLFNLQCWLGGNVKHLYVNFVIANYGDGGISSIRADDKMIEDYPENVISIVAGGQWSSIEKIQIFSKVMRKILMRYGVFVLWQQLIKKDCNRTVKILSLFWLPLELIAEKIIHPITSKK